MKHFLEEHEVGLLEDSVVRSRVLFWFLSHPFNESVVAYLFKQFNRLILVPRSSVRLLHTVLRAVVEGNVEAERVIFPPS